MNIKNEIISTYSAVCTIDDCYVCGRLKVWCNALYLLHK